MAFSSLLFCLIIYAWVPISVRFLFEDSCFSLWISIISKLISFEHSTSCLCLILLSVVKSKYILLQKNAHFLMNWKTNNKNQTSCQYQCSMWWLGLIKQHGSILLNFHCCKSQKRKHKRICQTTFVVTFDKFHMYYQTSMSFSSYIWKFLIWKTSEWIYSFSCQVWKNVYCIIQGESQLAALWGQHQVIYWMAGCLVFLFIKNFLFIKYVKLNHNLRNQKNPTALYI